MIRKLRITVDKYIFSYLASSLRKTNRLAFYNVILTPFKTIMADYLVWRNATITKARVTNETKSIEWYLNLLFDPTLKRIYITTNDGNGVPFGLRATEVASKQAMGLRTTEPANKILMPLRGEHPTLGTANFGVFIPPALNAQSDAIRGIVKIYGLAGKTFKILNP